MSLNKLTVARTPALSGRGAKNNRLILESFALKGALNKWDVFSDLKEKGIENYPTISRRIDDLERRGYIAVVGSKTIKTGRKENCYGLTWRGFIASLISEKACSNVLNVLEKNPQLEFPFPKDEALPMIRELFSDEQIEKRARSLLQAFIEVIPNDVESIEEKELFAYLFPTLMKDPTLLKEIEQKVPSILHESYKYPKTLNWLNPRLDKYIKTLEEALETLKKLREMLQRR